MAAKKTSMGRQRIKIAKIEKANHRQVTFSKRRSGLFKKACELCTLCGVEIVIIVFSPGGKVFSFGQPNVDALINRFLTRGTMSPAGGTACTQQRIQQDLNKQLTDILHLLEVEKKRGEQLDLIRESRRSHCWWENPIDKLEIDELEQLRTSMEGLKKKIRDQKSKVVMMESSYGSGMGGSVFEHYERKPHVGLIGPCSSSSSSSVFVSVPPPGFLHPSIPHAFGNF